MRNTCATAVFSDRSHCGFHEFGLGGARGNAEERRG